MSHDILHDIQEDGYFYWECAAQGYPGHRLRAHIQDEAVRYQPEQHVVQLPICLECNRRADIKADYVLEDLFYKMLCPVVNPETQQFHGYVMKRSHALNFRLLNMLYEIGKLPEPPLLPVLPFDAIKRSELRGLPFVAIDSIFLVYAAFGECMNLSGIDQTVRMVAGPITPLIEKPVQGWLQ